MMVSKIWVSVGDVPRLGTTLQILRFIAGMSGGAAELYIFILSPIGNTLMENLSVRTLYDKIDDQNMFLTAQLARLEQESTSHNSSLVLPFSDRLFH